MCPLLFSTSPLPQRLEGFTDTIGHIFKKAGDCRAFWCKCEPKTSYEVFELHISAGGVCTRSLAWTGVWCSSSSELVPLKHSLLKWQGAWKGVLMHSGGWLWLTSSPFLSVCPSLSTTSNGEPWRLYLPPAALRALQPRDSGGVLLWSWLHPHQWLQIHHLPVWRVVPLLPSLLCQNR